jgi:hypothetical protein
MRGKTSAAMHQQWHEIAALTGRQEITYPFVIHFFTATYAVANIEL